MYEHLHRYLWSAPLVRGRRVLDLASGEGFGAAILSDSAAAVVGVDIDAQSVEHATLNYDRANLSFAVADARDLGQFEDRSFGAVVAFEMIEHIEEQDRLLDEIQRVLEPDGLLIVSTPDREAYDEASGENPFHVRELSHQEFATLLRSRFANVGTWGQRTVAGSALAELDRPGSAPPPAPGSFIVQRVGDEWRPVSQLPPLYVVAVASNGELPAAPAGSTLSDPDIQLVRAAESAAAERAQPALRAAQERLAQENAALRARAAHDAHTISSLDAALNAANRRLARVESSVTWQMFQKTRGRVFGMLGGEDSQGAEVIQRTLRAAGRKLRTGGAMAPGTAAVPEHRPRSRGGSIKLPVTEGPEVSIVIPLYARADLTRAALESIRDYTGHVNYEVILVDDEADADTKSLLNSVHGARIFTNETNRGYIHSMHRGAAAARGRWLVLCNNDIEVQPGWLPAMMDCAQSSPDVGVVAPKFLSPDGSLSEAGAVIWRDGTGANYGRGDDPSRCHYEYRREIDYGSAAALMVRTDFWQDVGGFDERFLPMYYEDADLCFEARARGLRVMYEPSARVIHVEGASAGVDESAGHKRHQQLNRPKFVEKWGQRLEAEHLPNDQRNLWSAANLRGSPHVLVIDHRVPMWDREAGAVRMRAVLAGLVELGCHVSLLPDNLMPVQPYTRELQRLGVEVLYGVEIPADIERMARTMSLVILSRPQVATRWLELVREHAPHATVVYDTVDLHWLREARRAAAAAGVELDENALPAQAKTMRELECALFRASDVTLVVTDAERERVLQDAPGTDARVLPVASEVQAEVPSRAGRGGLVFVGGFEHPPNVDAALTLIQDVMPAVWAKLGDVPLTVIGADPPPEIEALASATVDIMGWVPDLDPYLGSSIALVAPLRYGAGLKGKVTQALGAGLPVVTTPIGAEGLDAVDGEHLLIGGTPEELADRVVRLVGDGQLWQHLSDAGRLVAARVCGPAVMEAALADLLVDLPGSTELALGAAVGMTH